MTDYMMAQVSKATITRDAGGPAARRVKNEVTGSAASSLRALPFVLPRRNSKDPVRYSLVVLNRTFDSLLPRWTLISLKCMIMRR